MECSVNLKMLNSLSRTGKFLQGEAIVCDGLDKKMFVVLKGRAAAFSRGSPDRDRPIAAYGPGDFFGESILFLGKKPLFDYVALTDLIVLQINRCSFSGFLRDEPEITFELIKALCARSERSDSALKVPCGRSGAEPEFPCAQPPAASGAPADPSAACCSGSSETGFPLFPEGHGNYTLPLDNEDRVFLMETRHTCPLCRHVFTALKDRPSKLVVEQIEPDTRIRYKGVEPLYYEVVTCPHCLYSALGVMFANPDRPAAELAQKLSALKAEARIKFGMERNARSVFAGYYLALYCAPMSFSAFSLAQARLLLNLSRIYADCGDSDMERTAAGRSLDRYLYTYENAELSRNQFHQLCMTIGNLYASQSDFSAAKTFYLKVKTSRDCAPRLKRQAENRLYDLQELEQLPAP